MAGKSEKEKKTQEGITAKKDTDFSEWYIQSIIKGGFVDYTAVSGCLAFRPDGYFAWEVLMRATDAHFKEIGIQNVYFPLFIPERFLNKEKEHVEGFSPEVAWVTHTGESELEERLAVRPTSETIMYDSFAKWIRSWRDLPMRLNQWNNVVRWEFKHPVPLLRSREFLWNEGHTVFATEEEAELERDVVLGIYAKVLKDVLAISGIVGRKTESEKFAGAIATFSIEHVIPGGKIVQGPDFHLDGQNFAKAFGISFIDKDEKKKYAYQNTFAITTRELGAMAAIHGDDKGLVLPPKVARIQVVIVPIYKDENRTEVLKAADTLNMKLGEAGTRTFLDAREAYSPGWKFNEWEMKGVPVRIELGARELREGKAVATRRDTGAKISIDMNGIEEKIAGLLEEIQEDLYKKAQKFLADSIHVAKTYDELKKIGDEKGGLIQVVWCGDANEEAKIKEETGFKTSNMPLDMQKDVKGKCFYCGKEGKHVVNFGRAY
ncbi:MAG: proline--tRNA ligase [Candidatus Micrarchaeales archaeon]|nr:proline--tRNA ligase [Candidatus Micrarchaeales archaeon]